MNLRTFFTLFLVTTFAGCATFAGLNYDQLFGEAQVRDRQVSLTTEHSDFFLSEVKPIIDNRCVVCHACYDAPCQLKMSSVAGIDRGASKELVYQGTRLTAATPSRLFEDAQTTEQWRSMGFHPVLNERDQTRTANIEAGLVAKMLIQKKAHPLPNQTQLEGFDFSIDRSQVCPTIEEYDSYAQDYPTWGMPYGMPNLSSNEYSTLMSWLQNGAIMNAPIPLTLEQQALVEEYEQFLNNGSRKAQLTARYIYEHLFLSHLYFSELNETTPRFFTLVRSETPPGQPVKRIATRRPYDDPNVDRVYYRFVPEQATIVDKTHMPFALNSQRINNWKAWFIDTTYDVAQLPGYEPEVAANPMTAFIELPVKSRFNFMLDNAQNTINAFIKGPVCRGQLALNVINDRFWVFFLDPDKSDIPEVNEFYHSQADNLKLPGELESNTLPVANWVSYSRQQARYLTAKSDFINSWFKDGKHLTTDVIWTGNGTNSNAALTVFRHFDSASVVQGLVGKPPKTAWVLDYALIERIHYLLVAGFDVYGNFGHQLMTRMFMDFLRLEGESNFVALLPRDIRHVEQSSWYQNQSTQLSDFLQRNVKPFDQPTQVPYQTDNPKQELYDILKTQLSPVLNNRYAIEQTGFSTSNEARLRTLDDIKGKGLLFIPQIVMLLIESESGQEQLFTLLHNNAHTNISSLFDEEGNRDYENDDLTLVRGVIGSYPATYLSLHENEISQLIDMLKNIRSEEDYVKLLDRFAIRRSSDRFWPFSDKVHAWYKENQPVEFGLLDYNRFENR
ncbi:MULTISPECIES: fatty acid cis/trans isomerase [Vibrio]|uniref:fatty acid cis/trans isomerase n=1 Tax=Vibrio TaxID=662 RepID=UPI0001B94A1F|nr:MULTISPECIES: fatty acid cis/trans isomerase [Vibrio]EEX32075.1 fatty acid cis/trans isomerase [Vibrio coralliilyticus ATCC BAA-450]MCM5509327.1 fatty acid cis/trans isomerase [Vibrio sp. SCSIO 43169]MDE3896744.1 fatty acid cis/trans isomerase [Vibrio sp. CC007]QFT39621.1 Fatty acid cis/trans isomerase (CTI) [Vibrio sp. THAF64]QGM37476.1 Fatty acid cis/trans isomerase (CTI) [Vibrio sp. THAF191d]